LLHSGQYAKRNNQQAGVEGVPLSMMVTQLCHMRTARDSTQLAQKNQRSVARWVRQID